MSCSVLVESTTSGGTPASVTTEDAITTDPSNLPCRKKENGILLSQRMTTRITVKKKRAKQKHQPKEVAVEATQKKTTNEVSSITLINLSQTERTIKKERMTKREEHRGIDVSALEMLFPETLSSATSLFARHTFRSCSFFYLKHFIINRILCVSNNYLNLGLDFIKLK